MNQLKDFKKIKFLHLIDHDGTISGLTSRLSVFPEHYTIASFPRISQNKIKNIQKLSQNSDIKCILHATGNKKYFYNLKNTLAEQFNHFYIFFHIAPKHFLIKGRINELRIIKKLTQKTNTKILIPSTELIKEYSKYGIKAIPIQLGAAVNKKINTKNTNKNKKYIITVCSVANPIYHYIKGVDRFAKLMQELNLNKYAIILGNNNKLFKGIKSKKLSQANFLEYLNHAQAYMQLSRTEAYNLSAISAKRLKIPIIVSNIEGHKQSVKYGFRVNNMRDAKKTLQYVLSNSESPKLKKILKKNYEYSIKKETLKNFRDSFKKLN